MATPALRALLERLIDYRHVPATLACDDAIANYRRYRTSQHAWMLRHLVIARAISTHAQGTGRGVES